MAADAVKPQHAPVRPRVVAPDAETLLLEDCIRGHLARRESGVVYVGGTGGTGKTIALRHLRAVCDHPTLRIHDEPAEADLPKAASDLLVVYAARRPHRIRHLAVYVLAPWGTDDLIEYLLHEHRAACNSVMQRILAAPDHELTNKRPAAWKVVLDTMAASEQVADVSGALRHYFAQRLPAVKYQQLARRVAIELLLPPHISKKLARLEHVDEEAAVRLLNLPGAQLALAADSIVKDILRDRLIWHGRNWGMPEELVREVARYLARAPVAPAHLLKCYARGGPAQAIAATLLLRLDPAWRPLDACDACLRGALLGGAAWARLDLTRADLERAQLAAADLTEAKLEGAQLADADLTRANLSGANLEGAEVKRAVFTRADLTSVRGKRLDFRGADLCGARCGGADLHAANLACVHLDNASFERASLRYCVFEGARLNGADFSRADLSYARFAGTDLRTAKWTGAVLDGAWLAGCNLEGVAAPGLHAAGAHLSGALLTGSFLPGACFADAVLTSTGLADISWERADLRGADLSRASFHQGSSRSGLVFSPFASEGTRTGFYTDEFNEQDFRAPEDIRKANLRGADLRGAHVAETDFYLVDLREAHYYPDQERHFRRCGAILESRVCDE